MKIKTKTLIVFLSVFVSANAIAKDFRQQEDISKIVKELSYLIQVTEQLKLKYRGDNSKITFNYHALLEQLKAARAGSKEYLNAELYEIHTAPPQIKQRNLTKVKP